MKKLIAILILVLFFFAGCEKEEIVPYFVGEWATYLPINKQKTDSLNICFKILNIHEVEYYTYYLEEFDFNKLDSTVFFRIYPNQFNTVKYHGKYNKEKDMFIGNSYHYINSDDSEYFLYMHKNVQTIRGMIY